MASLLADQSPELALAPLSVEPGLKWAMADLLLVRLSTLALLEYMAHFGYLPLWVCNLYFCERPPGQLMHPRSTESLLA